ncbi:MAG: transposase [Candidatus Delongbacteria bacterium]
MSRPERCDIAGSIQHVILTGHDRCNVFHQDADCSSFLSRLQGLIRRDHCALHGYCLMRNHVHLILTIGKDNAMQRLMQSACSGHSRRMNRQLARSGSFWNQRYWSEPLLDEDRIATCHLYVDSNPVRAGIVQRPADYRWSSYLIHAHGEPSTLIVPTPWYLGLAETASGRQAVYRRLMSVYLDKWRVRCQA